MRTVSDLELLQYMRSHKLAVISTLGADGSPQSALVGVAVTDTFQIIFDTVSTSRKHANLVRDPLVAVNFSGPAEQTLQYEGLAAAVSTSDPRDAAHRAIEWVRRAFANARHRLTRPPGEEARFELRVDVRRGERSRHATLVGRAQADATALGAAGTARLLIEGDVADPGAWMPEQVVDPGPFLSRLASRGLRVEFADGAPRGRGSV